MKILVCLAVFLFAAPALAAPVRFVILGDRTGGHVPGIYGEAVELVNRLEPDFVITVGDMIEGYGDDSLATEREWDEYDSIVSALDAPLYLVPGNHDIWSDASEAVYRQRCGEPYRSFDIGGCHFVVVDNSRWNTSEELPAGQLAWLERDLAAHGDADWTAVFFHKPFWYESVADGEPDTLHALCRAFGVDAVFSGHYHRYASGTYDGIRYTLVGSSGGALFDPELPGPGYHVLAVEAGADLELTPVTLEGDTLAWAVLPVADAKAAVRVRSGGLELLGAVPVDAGLAGAGRVRAVVHNVGAREACSASLRWTVTPGWAVEPEEATVELEPGGSDTVGFEPAGEGTLYPVPELAVELPYAPGGTVGVSRSLPVRRSVTGARTRAAPVIDGVAGDICWPAPETRLFDEHGPAGTDPTWFFFAADEEYLYLAAACLDRQLDSVRARARERDGTVWSDDCAGWFLQPDTSERAVYQLYVNPGGTVFDQRIEVNEAGYWSADRDWNARAEVATARDDDGWSVEMRIPLADFGVDDVPGTWGLNFRRKQPRLGNGDWQVPIGYDPDTYGRLVFP